MFRLSACTVLLFSEAGDDPIDRLRAAAAAGFDAIDIWGWEDLDRGEFRAALDDTGVSLLSMLVDGDGTDLIDESTHPRFLENVRPDSCHFWC